MPKVKRPKIKPLKRRRGGGGALAVAEPPARTRKGIYFLPNLFTTAGLFAGFYAIVQATKGHYEAAAVAIFIAMLMDGLDGRVARLTHTTSDFGTEYDSLTDMVSFGLSPALVLYEWALYARGKLGWLAAFFYVAMVALRLARFNTQQHHDPRYFQGLPSPAGAALVAATVWVMDAYGITGERWSAAAVGFTLLVAAAMVSTLPYRSFKDLDLKDRVPFVALLAVVLTLVVVSFDPPRVLFLIFALYFLSGPLVALARLRRRKA